MVSSDSRVNNVVILDTLCVQFIKNTAYLKMFEIFLGKVG